MLTITEAQAVNDVLSALLHRTTSGGGQPPERVREAAALLADKAHKPLMAGLTGDEVRTAWTDVVSRDTALGGFLEVWGAGDLMHDLGPRLTCRESDALVTLLATHARSTAANVLWNEHAAGDDEGDDHYRPRGADADQARKERGEAIACSECGHLHFMAATRTYDACPLLDEGCECPHGRGE